MGEKASVGFDPDQIRSLVSMATDSSYRVLMGKTASSRFPNAFDRILFILAGNDDMNEGLDEFEIWPDSTMDYGVSCPWAYEKKSHRIIMGEKDVITFSPLFLIGSFSYFQVMRTCVRA